MSIVGKIFINVEYKVEEVDGKEQGDCRGNRLISEKAMQRWTKYSCCGRSCKGRRGGRTRTTWRSWTSSGHTICSMERRVVEQVMDMWCEGKM